MLHALVLFNVKGVRKEKIHFLTLPSASTGNFGVTWQWGARVTQNVLQVKGLNSPRRVDGWFRVWLCGSLQSPMLMRLQFARTDQ